MIQIKNYTPTRRLYEINRFRIPFLNSFILSLLVTKKDGYMNPIANPKDFKVTIKVTALTLSSDPNHLFEKFVIEFPKKHYPIPINT